MKNKIEKDIKKGCGDANIGNISDSIKLTRVINVKNKPDFRDFLEVVGIEDIKKLEDLDYIIYKYKTKKETMYFAGNCFFIEKKQ